MAFRVELRWVDVSENLKTKEPPILIIERPLLHSGAGQGQAPISAGAVRKGRFWVAELPLTRDDPKWSLCCQGDFVRIPVFDYDVPLSNGALIFGVGFEVAMRAVDSWRRRSQEQVEALWLVLNHECHQLQPDGVRLYVGLAIETSS
jgi:hypothetical protein